MATSQPTVSVIIPVRNAAATLVETLQSLRIQSMGDFEALIIDDGSSDETSDIAAGWQARDQRFRLLSQPPSGVSTARNNGLSQARGEWVLFLDGDDWIDRDYFSKMLAVATVDPGADVIYCGYCKVTPNGVVLPMIYSADVEKEPFERLAEDCAICIHSVLLRRARLTSAHGFDSSLKTSEDWDLWIRLARMGARFRGLPEPLAFYRLRAGSATTDIAQMVRDHRDVVTRAHGPDPRVKDGPARYAAGACKGTVAIKCTSSAVYLAATEAAHGRCGLAALDVLTSIPDCKGMSDLLGGWLFAGLTSGAGLKVSEIRPEIEPYIGKILARIQESSSDPELARATLRKAARLILESDETATERTLWGVQLKTIDIRGFLGEIELDPAAEYVLLRWQRPGTGLFDLYAGVPDGVPRMDLSFLLLRSLRMRRLHARHSWLQAAGFLPLFGLWTVSNLRQIWRSKRARGQKYREFARAYPSNLKLAVRLLRRSRRTQGPALKDRQSGQALVAQLRKEILGDEPAATARRASVTKHRACEIPILMYHRVAEDGPAPLAQYRVSPALFEAQLRLLRQEGFSAIVSDDLRAALEGQRSLPPRPVMLTFDDAYRDFASALPLLKRYGFTAEVFVVTDKTGGTSDWDSAYGPTAPLMDWREIEALAQAGIAFGSHLDTHRRATTLDDATLIAEGAKSRFMLESRLGRECRSLALPFGDYDARVIDAMKLCGYDLVFTCDQDIARLSGDPLRLPRLEVMGDRGLDHFVALLPGVDRRVDA